MGIKKGHKPQYFNTLSETLVEYIPLVSINSEDFRERDKWCSKWYVRVEGEKEETWERSSFFFSKDNNFTKVVEGHCYHGRWTQLSEDMNRIIIEYKKDAMDLTEVYDLKFIGANTMVLAPHGTPQMKKKEPYYCLMVEVIHDRYAEEGEKIDWTTFIDILVQDGAKMSFWYVFWCVVGFGIAGIFFILCLMELSNL